MAHWTICCAGNYFLPMVGYFHRLLTVRKFVAADETPIQVLKEADRRPQSKSYVWLFRSGDDGLNPIIIYQYHPTRNGDAAAKFFQGSAAGTYINVDGYARYNKLKDFKRCCCYAQIRRYFLEAIPKGKEKDYTDPAVQGLLYCNKLFEYERGYREIGLSYKQIYNRAERIRNLLGRRNWLFCDTTDGADASMMVYSLLETARANGLNPQKYLEYLLEARPNKNMSDEELENMTPWNPEVQECCVNKS